MNSKTILRRNYQKKFDVLKKIMIEIPPQGWIKTIREFLGMTTTQLAKRIGVSQPRVFAMEKNEKNIKISTMERIADALDCDFVYAIVPREKFDDIIYKQAQKKAKKILTKFNKNMELKNQFDEKDVLDTILKDIVKDLLYKNARKLWD